MLVDFSREERECIEIIGTNLSSHIRISLAREGVLKEKKFNIELQRGEKVFGTPARFNTK